jgi:DNA-binding transcriptional regulator YiaG
VWLANGYKVRKTPHGDAVAIHDIEGLTETLCKTFVQKPRALSRTEFRYIRTSGLLLSQAALGSALGVDAQTVARWEKDKHIPKMADKMIRLIYLEHANGNVRLKSAFETLRAVERAMNGPQPTRVVVESKGEHWESRLEEGDELNEEMEPA